MRLVENLNPVPPLNNRKSIETFIDQSLLGDWAIRIEYCGINQQGQMDWLQWGTTLFAIRSPDNVLQAIDTCHAKHPTREIRIHAEKARPEMRMVYSVYRATESGLYDELSFDEASQEADQDWLASADVRVPLKAIPQGVI